MDNNPFRNQQSPTNNYNSPNGLGSQSQQQLYQNNNLNGYSGSTVYQQQAYQQPDWQYQQNNNLVSQQSSALSNTYLTNNNVAPNFSQQNTTFSTSSMLSPTPYSPYGTLNTSTSFNNVTSSPLGYGVTNTGYPPYTNNSLNQVVSNPTGYQNNAMYPGNPYQYGQQQQQQINDPSNFYIPQNFGFSSNNNLLQTQQPRHPPVDASALLKGSEIRRVECPVCKKMLEGDDMAINHHVNEHYS